MNKLGYLKAYEENDNNNIGDKHEAVSAWLQPNEINISIFDPITKAEHTIKGLLSPVAIQEKRFDEYFLFCMFAIYENSEVEHYSNFSDWKSKSFPNDVGDLGDYCALIDPAKFLERVDQAARNDRRLASFSRGLVSYFDEENFSGSFEPDKIIFSKKSSFKHQREYRISAFAPEIGDTCDELKFNIGDLSDIAFTCHKADLNSAIRITHKKSELR